ncbi:hypothetical protein, partial [Salmonella sp. SAL4438]|uniref:hypothetical protein n=1 Tax=Salmonella sp. SAL4438 TaxID=3159893 RepID=UPI00397E0F19
VCSVGFLRDPFPARVPDVYGSVPILFAWVVAAAWGLRPAGRFARVAASGVIVAATVACVIATALLGQIGERARRTGVTSGPSALW